MGFMRIKFNVACQSFFIGKSKYLQNVLRALCLDSIILCGSGRIKFVIELEGLLIFLFLQYCIYCMFYICQQVTIPNGDQITEKELISNFSKH